MKILFSLFTLMFLNLSFAQHDHGAGVTPAKLAHDASHRVGKLVDTGKIDETFIQNMSSLEIIELDHTDMSAPAFKVVVTAGTGVNQLAVLFDMKGKYMKNQIIAKGDIEASPWRAKGGSELIEAALHVVTEGADPKLAPFANGLKSASVAPRETEQGPVAVVTVKSSLSAASLELIVSLEGEVQSFKVIEETKESEESEESEEIQ